MSEFPFLDQNNHPNWTKLTSDRIKPEITHALELAEKNLEDIRTLDSDSLTFENTIKALEQATKDLNYAWGLVNHLDAVCNSPELRDAHNEMLPTVSAFGAKIPLDPKLWKVILAYFQTEEAKNLPAIDQRLLEETLADFREADADLPDEKQKRLEELKMFDFTNLYQDNKKMAIYKEKKEIALNDFFDTLLFFR